MQQLADFQNDFRNGIFSGNLPAGTTARDPDEAQMRFKVYRNNVIYSLSRALAKRFPVIERLVGSEFFNAMARLFIEQHPPKSPMIFEWGERFPVFLLRFPPVHHLAYLPDVARLEWYRAVAYYAEDTAPISPQDLTRAARNPAAARAKLNASVSVLESQYAAFSVWEVNQPGQDVKPVDTNTPQNVLILRDLSDNVHQFLISPGDTAFIKALHKQSLIVAAQTAADVEKGYDSGQILMTLVRFGAISNFKFGESL